MQTRSQHKIIIFRYTFATNELEMFAENLPGLPDNIRAAEDGTLWVGMAGLRKLLENRK